MQTRCINCMKILNVKDDVEKYRCPHCRTEYEYIEYVDIERNDANVIEICNNKEEHLSDTSEQS